MARKPIKPIAATVGAAFAGSMLIAGGASAAANPFGLTELNGGYAQLAGNHVEDKRGGNTKTVDGKCGAGKCGGNAKAADGKCGAGKCGGDAKMADGKCGTGKCGGAQ